MKQLQTDRWLAAVIIMAAAIMVLCFARRSTQFAALQPLPRDPPLPAAEVQDGRVNVNTAGLDELMTLTGIGEVRARAILNDREANGPFRHPEDLIRVKGIGEGILGGILDQITTGD